MSLRARCGERANTLTPGSEVAQVAIAGWSVDTQRESNPPYWTIAFKDHWSKGREPKGAWNHNTKVEEDFTKYYIQGLLLLLSKLLVHCLFRFCFLTTKRTTIISRAFPESLQASITLIELSLISIPTSLCVCIHFQVILRMLIKVLNRITSILVNKKWCSFLCIFSNKLDLRQATSLLNMVLKQDL